LPCNDQLLAGFTGEQITVLKDMLQRLTATPASTDTPRRVMRVARDRVRGPPREAAQPTARIAVPAPEHACRYDGKSPATLIALRLMPALMAEMRGMPGLGSAGRRVRSEQCEGLPLCEG
jgi:hypothetical protein